MNDERDDPIAMVTKRLSRLATLDDGDRAAIAALPFRIERAATGHYFVREGQRTDSCCILMSGYACRHKLASNGGRQIVSFHLPGDLLDLQHLLLPIADHNVQSITPARVAWMPADALKALARERPGVGAAMWRDSLIDASIFREWVLNVGRRDAKSRIAHMLCEFAVRRASAGLGGPEHFELPMNQEQIADATGLTPVHVNRMLRELSDEGVIDRNKREIRIADWKHMRRVADFEPAYLHEAA